MDSIDPASFLDAGFNAGLAQAQDDDHSFGQGAAGYGKRFGASFADQASSKFFTEFAYPAIFSEDRGIIGWGTAAAASVSCMRLNMHSWRTATMANACSFFRVAGDNERRRIGQHLSSGHDRGFGPAAQAVGYSVIQDVGFDVLREFWPEISRKFKLPFRDESDPAKQTNSNPAGR